MPPKPKYSRDEIINAAYEIARERGMDAVVARDVGRKLGVTASPIFTVFNGMEELKREVYRKARKTCADYLLECLHYAPAFKEFGLRWVLFADREPNLYRLLFVGANVYGDIRDGAAEEFSDLAEPVVEEIKRQFGLDGVQAKRLLDQMIIHAHGIAAFMTETPGRFTLAQIGRLLSETCLGIVFTMKIPNGNLNLETAEKMVSAMDRMPLPADG